MEKTKATSKGVGFVLLRYTAHIQSSWTFLFSHHVSNTTTALRKYPLLSLFAGFVPQLACEWIILKGLFSWRCCCSCFHRGDNDEEQGLLIHTFPLGAQSHTVKKRKLTLLWEVLPTITLVAVFAQLQLRRKGWNVWDHQLFRESKSSHVLKDWSFKVISTKYKPWMSADYCILNPKWVQTESCSFYDYKKEQRSSRKCRKKDVAYIL